MTELQFFPWPSGRKGHWYRPVTTSVPKNRLLRARVGDTLTIKYPSGTAVQARVFYRHSNLDTGATTIQLESSTGTRPYREVKGMVVPADYEHNRKRK